MPGPWYDAALDPEYFPNYPVQKGDVLEVGACDDEGNPQGTLLIGVDRLGSTSNKGRWLEATTVAASDAYYQWWLDQGDGPKGRSLYHFCSKGCAVCDVVDNRGRDVTHFSRARAVPLSDLLGKKLSWVTASPDAQKGVDAYLELLQGEVPSGPAPSAKAAVAKPKRGPGAGVDVFEGELDGEALSPEEEAAEEAALPAAEGGKRPNSRPPLPPPDEAPDRTGAGERLGSIGDSLRELDQDLSGKGAGAGEPSGGADEEGSPVRAGDRAGFCTRCGPGEAR